MNVPDHQRWNIRALPEISEPRSQHADDAEERAEYLVGEVGRLPDLLRGVRNPAKNLLPPSCWPRREADSPAHSASPVTLPFCDRPTEKLV